MGKEKEWILGKGNVGKRDWEEKREGKTEMVRIYERRINFENNN